MWVYISIYIYLYIHIYIHTHNQMWFLLPLCRPVNKAVDLWPKPLTSWKCLSHTHTHIPQGCCYLLRSVSQSVWKQSEREREWDEDVIHGRVGGLPLLVRIPLKVISWNSGGRKSLIYLNLGPGSPMHSPHGGAQRLGSNAVHSIANGLRAATFVAKS